ncbi:MAG: ComF family protein, partial [Mycobacteriales bacterium]
MPGPGIVRLFGPVADLVLPAACAGCGCPGRSLCDRCVRGFGGPRPHLPVPCPRGMPPTWAGGRYAG